VRAGSLGHVSDPGAERPRFTPGYGLGEATAEPGELVPWEHLRGWAVASRNYWVVTAGGDGRPHAMPVWGLWLDDRFLFSTDPASRKGRNIAANPEVVVHLESGDDVLVVEGAAERVTDAELLARMIDLYERKYGIRIDGDNPSTGVYLVRPRVAFGWRERDFQSSATRWSFSPGTP
jgi:hypothetical protein